MPPTKEELYEEGADLLNRAWDDVTNGSTSSPGASQPYADDMRQAMSGHDLAPRFALLTQILLKLLLPASEIRRASQFPDAPSGFSARSFAKNVVVPFDQHQHSILGGSLDPYVSNPLRKELLTDALMDGDPGSQWGHTLAALDYVEQHPSGAPQALVAALTFASKRRLTITRLLEQGLVLQAERAVGVNVNAERKELIEKRGPAFINELLDEALSAEGSSQTGTEAEVPWIRVYSPQYSPSAQGGWYAVYLFAADGSAAFLTLIQGVTTSSSSAIEDGKKWVHRVIGPQSDFADDVELQSTQGKSARPALYEKAAVYARRYDAGALPAEATLSNDLDTVTGFLATIYAGQAAQPHLVEDMSALTLDLVLEQAAAINLQLDEQVLTAAVAALRSGRHLLLTGPPGTGKTSFAQVLASAAASAGLCEGSSLTTGTSDWTSADTVGGYWPSPSDPSQLSFRPGQVLASIERRSWLIIDELNRADIDKAIGQLFTALSGQPVTLPFEAKSADVMLPVSIVPAGADPPVETIPYTIPRQWRLIATINTRDRDLLFSLSYALLRRFAVIDVPVPTKDTYLKILADKGGINNAVVAARVSALIDMPHRPLGPAILLDVCSYARERSLLVGDAAPDDTLGEAITAFILPQLDDLTGPQQLDIVAFASTHVLKGWSPLQVAEVFAETFHMEPQDLINTDAPAAGFGGGGTDADNSD